MKNEIKRRRILKALQAECAALGALTNKLESDLQKKHGKKAA
ncbi:hypothetical protein OU997_05420 [Pseudomonas sp. SL4(2022)]|nr:hypothetical protein [Pseudomonas sp. SL4(2022)]WAC45613.1 hypothetical protein OU997_05420 [Pseudomonas sp. SL4(2022)]